MKHTKTLLLLFILATHTTHALGSNKKIWVDSKSVVPAPGSLKIPGSIDRLDYYRWLYKVINTLSIKRVKNFEDMEEKITDFSKKFKPTSFEQSKKWKNLLKKWLSKTANFDPENPQHQKEKNKFLIHTYEKEVFINKKRSYSRPQGGAFLDVVWSWYKKELAYEKMKATSSSLTIGITNNSRSNSLMEESRSIYAVNKNFHKNANEILFNFSEIYTSNLIINEFIDDFKKLREKESFLLLQDRVKDFSKNSNFSKKLKFFRPTVLKKIEKNRNKIYVDVNRALAETLSKEKDGDLEKYRTIAFDIYAIVPTSIDSILKAYLYLHGLPTAGFNGSNTAETYPPDSLFDHRKETMENRSAFWGEGSYLNHSTKKDANQFFVEDINATYAILKRGNKNDGYDLIIQFLGLSCTPSNQSSIKECTTTVKSHSTVLMVRPIDENHTAYKITSRFVGQEQSILLRRTVGFNKEKFYSGTMNIIKKAKEIDKQSLR